MKKALVISLLTCCTACMLFDPSPNYVAVPGYLYTPEASVAREVPSLLVNSSLHIQYSGDIDLNKPVDAYNLDLFDTDPATISQLHNRGVFVMCYFNAGSMEDWRADAGQFPQEVLGNDMEDWPGETWLDIRQVELLKPIMEARLDMAVAKGCDGVDPDNVNGFENDTGFSLSYEAQLAYNIFLSTAAHERGLAIGLKNDITQISELVSYFDWAINEECFFYEECETLLPFVQNGKPVFVIEYELAPEEFCPRANEWNFTAMQKNWELDEYFVSCK